MNSETEAEIKMFVVRTMRGGVHTTGRAILEVAYKGFPDEDKNEIRKVISNLCGELLD